MLVFIKLDRPVADRTHAYSHIECDVKKCKARSPSSRELAEGGKSLVELGWFIDGGHHRCPRHYDEATPPSVPVYREK